MCDVFLDSDAKNLLKDKFILLVGDSNMRCMYKDLLYLITQNKMAQPDYFKNKKAKSACGDTVVKYDTHTRGRDFFEERVYKEKGIHIRFHFITKVYGKSMLAALNNIENGNIDTPDVIIINSCLWDLTRWGPKKEDDYKNEMRLLFTHLNRILPESTIKIWNTTLPLSVDTVKGGVMIKQLEFTKHSMRFMIMEANLYAQKLCQEFQFDLLDLHYHLRFQLHRRSVDGIHWETQAVRHVTCLVLTHICLALGQSLPGNVQNEYVDAVVDLAATRIPVKTESTSTLSKPTVDVAATSSQVSQRKIKKVTRKRKKEHYETARDLRSVLEANRINHRMSFVGAQPFTNSQPFGYMQQMSVSQNITLPWYNDRQRYYHPPRYNYSNYGYNYASYNNWNENYYEVGPSYYSQYYDYD